VISQRVAEPLGFERTSVSDTGRPARIEEEIKDVSALLTRRSPFVFTSVSDL